MSNLISSVPSILSDAQYVARLYDHSKHKEQTVPQQPFHAVQVENKVHNDKLAVDPTWINGVHCHASISRHNYIYADMAQKPLANQ
jgi:hypothetical protein